ncbi:MAG: ChbG/HpnK family deacetylase [Verrucomicrobiota bacterium]
MLTINADDWGRSKAETDIAHTCHALGTVTSVSAMVFMKDSERAAEIACHEDMDAGLHLNFTEAFTGDAPPRLREAQSRIARFLRCNKYALLFYHPLLGNAFRYVYAMQADEFHRLYGLEPSRFDGHQHMHLCSNMLFDRIIPRGSRVRGTFSFQRGDKGALNRAYRAFVKWWMTEHYAMPDYFFALSQCLGGKRLDRALELARSAQVEVMTHPVRADEYGHLTSENFRALLADVL